MFFSHFFVDIILKEGLSCDYMPSYCLKHEALAYAVFPTNAFGKCDKKPTLHREFCQQKDDSSSEVLTYSAEIATYV